MAPVSGLEIEKTDRKVLQSVKSGIYSMTSALPVPTRGATR